MALSSQASASQTANTHFSSFPSSRIDVKDTRAVSLSPTEPRPASSASIPILYPFDYCYCPRICAASTRDTHHSAQRTDTPSSDELCRGLHSIPAAQDSGTCIVNHPASPGIHLRRVLQHFIILAEHHRNASHRPTAAIGDPSMLCTTIWKLATPRLPFA